MSIVIITQCRLCARRFEESIYAANDSFYLSRRTGVHPFEDGCPWCDECRVSAFRAADRLLSAVPGLLEPLADAPP